MMSLDIQRIRALCFDIDGTLSDTDDQYVLRLARWLAPLRHLLKRHDPATAARWIITSIETPGNWLIGLADRLGIDEGLARVSDAWMRKPVAVKPNRHLIIHGVTEMLEALQPHYAMSIISVRRQRSVLHFLEASNLKRFFPVIASGQTCPHTKPYPDPLLWAAAQLGVPPAACLMIGDTVVDVRTGRAAGAQTVGVLCGFGTPEELSLAGADLLLDSTASLANALGVACQPPSAGISGN